LKNRINKKLTPKIARAILIAAPKYPPAKANCRDLL